MTRQERKPISVRRHQRNCLVCAHPSRCEIEADFVSWRSPAAIAKQHGLTDRSSIYRHAHAFALFGKRRRNLRAALECLIEQAAEVEVTASSIVSAVQALAKINAAGEWVEPEQVSMRELYERMTARELEDYAATARLPDWFKAVAKTANA
jgi:hypothetical protein